MKSSAVVCRVKVSVNRQGGIRGVGMSRGMADLMGLSAQVTAVPADAYEGPRTHAPGDVLAGVADGEDRLVTCP